MIAVSSGRSRAKEKKYLLNGRQLSKLGEERGKILEGLDKKRGGRVYIKKILSEICSNGLTTRVDQDSAKNRREKPCRAASLAPRLDR